MLWSANGLAWLSIKHDPPVMHCIVIERACAAVLRCCLQFALNYFGLRKGHAHPAMVVRAVDQLCCEEGMVSTSYPLLARRAMGAQAKCQFPESVVTCRILDSGARVELLKVGWRTGVCKIAACLKCTKVPRCWGRILGRIHVAAADWTAYE